MVKSKVLEAKTAELAAKRKKELAEQAAAAAAVSKVYARFDKFFDNLIGHENLLVV